MKRINKSWNVVFLLTLLIPGYALGAATFTLDHPETITVGQTFNVTVYLSADSSPPPTNVHAYQYCFDYDQTKIQLEPVEIACSTTIPPVAPGCFSDPGDPSCIVQPPVDGAFFTRTCEDNCTAQDFPIAKNCCNACAEQCDPGNILFIDFAGFNPGEPPECVCARTAPFDRRLVSTFTFRAIGAGTVEFLANSECTFVVDCDDNPTEPSVVSPPITIREKPPIPALSSLGMAVFALLIAGSFIVIMKRYRRTGKNMGALLVLLAVGVTLSCGLSVPQIALAAAGCPDECQAPVKLDLNNDALINVIDISMLSKCIKSSCTDQAFDVNGDAQINQDDYKVLVNCVKKGCSKAQ